MYNIRRTTFTTQRYNFLSIWDTRNTSTGSTNANQIKLPLFDSGGSSLYNFSVNWGDGTANRITSATQPEVTHTYAVPGVYTITINGRLEGWQFNNTGDRLKLLEILQFGGLRLLYSFGFYGCENLELDNVRDTLILTSQTSLGYTFMNCKKITRINNLEHWKTNTISNWQYAFRGMDLFNQNLNVLDFSGATMMDGMIRNSPKFNNGGVNMNLNTPLCTTFITFLFSSDGFLVELKLNYSSINLTGLQNFMASKSNYPPDNLSKIYQDLDTSGKTGITADFGGNKYTSSGSAARANLVAKTWNLTDGGLA